MILMSSSSRLRICRRRRRRRNRTPTRRFNVYEKNGLKITTSRPSLPKNHITLQSCFCPYFENTSRTILSVSSSISFCLDLVD